MNQHKGWTRVMSASDTGALTRSQGVVGRYGEGSGGWSRQPLSSALVVGAVDQGRLHEEVCNQCIF